ncbi:MAG TPA: XF1762 family protein [Thermoanaerobaculia bacterium]|nr:XF1762 family protein [Thermoanaerobaculia bacterium]
MPQTVPRRQPSECLRIVPVTLRAARAYVNAHHRHLRAPAGAKLAIGVQDGAMRLRGVAILGRPVARLLDNGGTIEVTRLATDGCANACSALYGAARRAAKALGYQRIVTYTLASEGGHSLRASGWAPSAISAGGPWSRRTRRRHDMHPLAPKRRWTAVLDQRAP